MSGDCFGDVDRIDQNTDWSTFGIRLDLVSGVPVEETLP
jgi:hypothetical protein